MLRKHTRINDRVNSIELIYDYEYEYLSLPKNRQEWEEKGWRMALEDQVKLA